MSAECLLFSSVGTTFSPSPLCNFRIFGTVGTLVGSGAITLTDSVLCLAVLADLPVVTLHISVGPPQIGHEICRFYTVFMVDLFITVWIV